MDLERLIQLARAGDFEAAQALLLEAGRRRDGALEHFALGVMVEAGARTRIHQGPLFEVHRLRSPRYDVCVKRVALQDDDRIATSLAAHWSDSNETNIFMGRGMGGAWYRDAPRGPYYERLLRAEFAVIQRVAGQWNHPGARLTRWQPGTHLEVKAEGVLEGDLCMVMPTCQGQSLSDYPRERQRKIFPSLLPALWRALTHHAHGDLSPEDVWMDRSEKFFRILDPGVCIRGHQWLRNDHPDAVVGALDFRSVLFTTNVEHYPVLRPAYGDGALSCDADDGFDDLEAEVRGYLRAEPFSLVDELSLDSAQPTLFHFFERIHAYRQRYDGVPAPLPNPCAPDVIAMGIMYFRILTGRRFLDLYPVEWPLWAGYWSDRGNRAHPFPDFADHLDVLTQALDAATHLSVAERRLCEDLIGLQVHSLQDLSLIHI